MTNTMFLLMAQYGTVEIPLESLCEMLGSKPATIFADAARREREITPALGVICLLES